ncbi:hypothetical protein DWQ65_12920 [Treponema phagedenis]|uniref:Uncharacterized protein n=1 Tax=Treponema phagedenis TaxID=162 RepID=A0AAE6IUB3_TREPH|nr:hypothetical protein FUT82_10730 [Treponema phagedenis]QEK00713.1 hypothetical protein FUT84_05715 [Treponema phagedenis]QEK03932.1 hypothetical protein FUT83_09040 [Treponema phagedenis]QEK09548.1 hypothetical protein FUT81_08950 [Treponema phagedenis]QSH95474.1 hypothetical protein C5O78_10685 [Treponema phagedenis]
MQNIRVFPFARRFYFFANAALRVGVLRAPLTLRLFLRYFRRAKRIRLRAFEKALAALRMPNTD